MAFRENLVRLPSCVGTTSYVDIQLSYLNQSFLCEGEGFQGPGYRVGSVVPDSLITTNIIIIVIILLKYVFPLISLPRKVSLSPNFCWPFITEGS